MDAIKEGDGSRLVRCFKLALLFEYKFKHTKYAFVLLLFFAKIYALLSEKEAFKVVHNRFVNKTGKQGGNILLDLHTEHLNLDLKKLLNAMGGKITEASAQRCARSITVLNKVMDGVYQDCRKSRKGGFHRTKNANETVRSITDYLLQITAFQHTPGREDYPSFKRFKATILEIDYKDFCSWVQNHLKQWKGIYETPNQQAVRINRP